MTAVRLDQGGNNDNVALLCTRDGRLTGTEMRIVALWVAVRGGLVALLPWADVAI